MTPQHLTEWGKSLIEKVKQDSAKFGPLQFSIFYSPVTQRPRLMIIGDNPGGALEQHGLLDIPREHEYLHQKYKIADMMRNKIMKGDILQSVLKESVKTNRIFFRTPRLSTLDSFDDKGSIINYCKVILHEIIDTIQPQNILAESFGTFRSLSNVEKAILIKPNSKKPLLLLGQLGEIPVFGINHPSRASYHKINDSDWALVNKELEARLR
jgi:hypothetical protein